MSPSRQHVVGLISDTHGLLRTSIHNAFAGVELILHAGDVGGSDILEELRLIAPVKATFGNTDSADDPELVKEIAVSIDGVRIHVSHGHETGSPTPEKLAALYDADVIVYGHTHRQLVKAIGDKLIVNPGAAGARRFNLKPSVARLNVSRGKAEVEVIELA
ncbi:MAG: metallophosphoesterase [Gemmatimonadaceae bacterium]